ncbi:hypothetical protein JTB14_021588 [Gonioctena quinquepunctata]|nr:hypothetical protein JTB14_021588 [Gonioctena quinquepunctata]
MSSYNIDGKADDSSMDKNKMELGPNDTTPSKAFYTPENLNPTTNEQADHARDIDNPESKRKQRDEEEIDHSRRKKKLNIQEIDKEISSITKGKFNLKFSN